MLKIGEIIFKNVLNFKEQYEFLYQCLVDFADMFGIYSQSSGSFHSRNSLTDSLYRKSPAKQSSTTDVAKLNHVQLNL